jgi:hypothetical protein
MKQCWRTRQFKDDNLMKINFKIHAVILLNSPAMESAISEILTNLEQSDPTLRKAAEDSLESQD